MVTEALLSALLVWVLLASLAGLLLCALCALAGVGGE